MAIENDPNFPAWSASLDRLIRAWDEYNQAKAVGYTEELASREAAVFQAIRDLARISDEMNV